MFRQNFLSNQDEKTLHNPLENFHSSSNKPSDSSQTRLIVLMGCFFLCFLILAFRLSYVCLFKAVPALYADQKPLQERGEILDRSGCILASSISVLSLYAHPLQIQNKKEVALQLHAIFPDLDEKKILQLLDSNKKFVWLARRLDPSLRLKVESLGIEGLGFAKEYKRVYPHESLFAHVLGFVNVDQEGIAGLEKSFDHRLRIEKKGIQLSLDLRLQHVISSLLQETIDEFSAKGGNSLLVDIETGEILSMVSLPSFSPSDLEGHKPEDFFNRNVSGVYEFGSILKIFNVALGLENKVFGLSSVFDASSPLQLGRFKITDFKGQNRPLTVEESFTFSSNIANAKMALACGAKAQQSFFKKMGFFSRIKTELFESAMPILPKQWTKFQIVTTSYGYGLSLSPLHLVQGLQILLKGYKCPLTLLKKEKSFHLAKRWVREETTSQLLYLLEKAVLEGQAKKAKAFSCRVGAKTGTANQAIAGVYRQKNNLTSCASVFPLENPRYLLLVCIDRPKPNAKTHYYATAGWIAAPLVAKIVDAIAHLLGTVYAPKPF